QMEAFGRAVGEIVFDWLALVDGRSIPDDEHLTPNFVQEHAQETDHRGSVKGVVLHLHHQPPLEGDTADRREMVVGEGHVQHWRLSPWRPGSLRMWQQIEAGFIYPDDVVSFVGCFFLIAGQRCSYQRRTASSSRWVARCIGRCTLQPV